ncbi:MAG: hypothetical protein HZB14_04155 [Actinobacteria bacterium]|nr:hypothetical protein [Actinomycetota bacterium]
MRPALACLAVALALSLAGCGGSDEESDVSAALSRTAAVERLAYSGSVEMATSGPATGGAASGERTEITFMGAIDESDPAAPKSLLDMTVQGEPVRAVVPGDGSTYVSTPTGIYGAPIDAGATSAGGFGAMLNSLMPVLDDFKSGNDDSTKDGLPLRTVSAKAGASGFCDEVAPAFSNYTDMASANVSSVKGLTGDAPLGEVCRKLLAGDPTLWFGIDAEGRLRMVAMNARLTLLGAGELEMTLRFDVTSLGEQVTIVKPVGATMLGSQAELRRRAAVPSGG